MFHFMYFYNYPAVDITLIYNFKPNKYSHDQSDVASNREE